MLEHSLSVLEFDKVLARLAGLTSFSAGRELALTLQPVQDRARAAELHATLAEARRLREVKPNLGFAGAHDVRPYAEKAALAGVLQPGELLEIASLLTCARNWSQTLERLSPGYGLLRRIAARLDPLQHLNDQIGRSVTPHAEVADGASPALPAIRREIHAAHDRLVTRVNQILNSAAGRLAAQEPIITERGGRYVIPVKADMRGHLRGIVHDVSQSGATLFIEPLAIVDLGNQWRELQLQEEREVERVLRELSATVGLVAGQIAADVEGLAEFDVLWAKARLGDAIGAPDLPAEGLEQRWIVEAGQLRLINARHPLLTGDVVPNTIAVGDADRVLLITGPNTGGKTVALKTAGLLTLMALSGIPVPAEFGSQVPVYDAVFADIGDEQSIEQSLSTFSSHMRNIIQVIRLATRRTLVLLDELGAGTDPEEGAALAKAVVAALLERGTTVIATTHHGELKVFAHETAGVQNASVEFDEQTLAPTYRLSIGIPGRSNAIAIARRLGMPEEVLRAAERAIPREKTEVDTLLREVQRTREQLDEERRAETVARGEAEEIRTRLHQRLAEVEAEREQVVRDTVFEMERELAAMREQLRAAARVLKTAPPPPAVEQAKMELGVAAEAPRRLRKKLAGRRHTGIDPAQVQPGDSVWIRGVVAPGEALAVPDERGEMEVTLGSLRTRVRLEQVERVQRPPSRRPAGPITLPETPLGSSEIEIRAQRVDEVLPRLERFLDEAFRTGLHSVRIIHGKGTGTLRRVVRELLAEHPLVTSYETAERGEGGEGVTVAHLAV